MSPQTVTQVKVFCSYAHEDEKLRDQLKDHLSNLRNQGLISDWYDRDIAAGQEWNEKIRGELDSARVILLLVSPAFMGSKYINNVELKRAMEKHHAGQANVIPVILRPVDWKDASFSGLEALPTDGKPVTSWQNRDEAFLNVVEGIRATLEKLTDEPQLHTYSVNIPRPPLVGFVARRDSEGRDIIERLKEELDPRKNQLIVLSGPGGVGKTTLAVEATRALANTVGGVVWTSALGREDYSFQTLLDEIATQLGQPGLRTLAPDPKAEQVQALIAATTPLIILDNFETIAAAEQNRCVEFLLNHASCPTLITTRQKIPSARNITIPVMSEDEAGELLRRLIEQVSDPDALAALKVDRIMEASDRNPLVMQWVVGQIDLAQDVDTVFDELAHGEGDAAQRVFDRSFGLDQLGDDGRATLLALSLFTPDASRPALAQVAGFGDDEKHLNEAVRRLSSLWLVKLVPGASRLTVAGLTREFAKACLAKHEFAHEVRQRFVAYFQNYALEHAKPEPMHFDALEIEKDNLLAAMDIGFTLGEWRNVMGLMDSLSFDGVNGFLVIRGYWDEAIHKGEQALEAATNEADEKVISRFSHNLAISYHNRGELDEARRLYNESLEIKKTLGDQGGIARSLQELGRLAQFQGELYQARRLYNESLEIKKTLGDQGGIAISLHQLAMLAQDQGELDEARRLYNESLEIVKRLGDQGSIAISLHQLARVAEHVGERDEALRLYNESLEIVKRLGDQSGIASSLHQLGYLAEASGDNEEAARLFAESLAIFEKLKSPNAEVARRSLKRVKAKIES